MRKEIILLGEQTTYQVRYDDDIVMGANLLTDPQVAVACRADMAALCPKGEDLATFLARTGVLAETGKPS